MDAKWKRYAGKVWDVGHLWIAAAVVVFEWCTRDAPSWPLLLMVVLCAVNGWLDAWFRRWQVKHHIYMRRELNDLGWMRGYVDAGDGVDPVVGREENMARYDAEWGE